MWQGTRARASLGSIARLSLQLSGARFSDIARSEASLSGVPHRVGDMRLAALRSVDIALLPGGFESKKRARLIPGARSRSGCSWSRRCIRPRPTSTRRAPRNAGERKIAVIDGRVCGLEGKPVYACRAIVVVLLALRSSVHHRHGRVLEVRRTCVSKALPPPTGALLFRMLATMIAVFVVWRLSIRAG